MPRSRILLLTSLAMLAFAANSLLCRIALRNTEIDAASFTTIRLASGALILCLISALRSRSAFQGGNALSALALFAYAVGFSFAYESLPASTGALILFGAVQATMIFWGQVKGERLSIIQLLGILLAFAGVVILFLPSLAAPAPLGAVLMAGAGAAWGVYSLRGRGAGDAIQTTAGNFLRAAPMALLISLISAILGEYALDEYGVACAIASGAVTSGLGYVIWYSALPSLKAASAASVQLAVPALTSLGAILLLGEPLTIHLLLASATILGGIALVNSGKSPPQSGPPAGKNTRMLTTGVPQPPIHK